MNRAELIDNALRLPPNALPYYVSQQLALLFPEKALIECKSNFFDVEEYAKHEVCDIAPQSGIYNEFVTDWDEPDEEAYNPNVTEEQLSKNAYNAWLKLSWQEQKFEMLLLNWVDGYTCYKRCWLIAENDEIGLQFIDLVCRWNAEVRSEILVFVEGDWHKDERLFQAIKSATFDNLVLPTSLKENILTDLTRFFTAKDVYQQFHLPWKRGILFSGSPGNGKTHAIKAIINALEKPCLYVKSFKAQYRTDERNISEVFGRARKSAPCLLVLEDLDSLLTDENRSFFLNELDGFASNIGIVILATTNHPERLDPAILDRPSRFDRIYPFNLPDLSERIAYITLWNRSLQLTMHLSEPAISQIGKTTYGFSFAYLKELFLASIMEWIATSEDLEQIMLMQVVTLRKQMTPPSESGQPTKPPTEVSESAKLH